MKIKSIGIVIVIVCLISLLSGCTTTPSNGEKNVKELFLGIWKDNNFNGNEWIFTFLDDGTYDTNRTIAGTWRVLNETHVELEISESPIPYRYIFSDNDQSLTLTATGYGTSWTYYLNKIG